MFIEKATSTMIFNIVLLLMIGTLAPLATAGNGDEPPHLGEEIIISELIDLESNPAVAYNWKRDEYLVVWENYDHLGSRLFSINAQLINGQGGLISGFEVAPDNQYPNRRQWPSVAYDPVNDRYLVVWEYDYSGTLDDYDIHGIFINWDGPISGMQQFSISNWGANQRHPKVAYADGQKEFTIVWWNDYSTVPINISGRRMKAVDGSFVSPGSDFTISHDTEVRIYPRIAYNSARNEYLVVYDNEQDVFATRFNGAGQALSGGEFVIAGWPGEEIYPSVAACQETDQYLVAWQNNQPDIYVRFVKGDGTVDGGPLHLDYTSLEETEPQVGCNAAGNQFLVVWEQQFTVNAGLESGSRGQLINTDKTVGLFFVIKSPPGNPFAGSSKPAVVGGKNQYMAVWQHSDGSVDSDIHGRLITPYTEPFHWYLFLPAVIGN